MLVTRAVAVGLSLVTVAKVITSAERMSSSQLLGKKLQRLRGVPGCDPSRVNDLLLLQPDTDCSDSSGKSGNKHVVFFHGDIQVGDAKAPTIR